MLQEENNFHKNSLKESKKAENVCFWVVFWAKKCFSSRQFSHWVLSVPKKLCLVPAKEVPTISSKDIFVWSEAKISHESGSLHFFKKSLCLCTTDSDLPGLLVLRRNWIGLVFMFSSRFNLSLTLFPFCSNIQCFSEFQQKYQWGRKTIRSHCFFVYLTM